MRQVIFDFDLEILWAVNNNRYDYYVCRLKSTGAYFNIYKVANKFHIEMASEDLIRAWGRRDISNEKFLEIFGEGKDEWFERWCASL